MAFFKKVSVVAAVLSAAIHRSLTIYWHIPFPGNLL